MALRKAFCPNCGQPTQIDDLKAFCFCLSCGNKIIVPRREQTIIEDKKGGAEYEPRQSAEKYIEETWMKSDSSSVLISTLEDKMKEAEFYYKLSIEKAEYANVNEEPTYYLKGQDLLVNLSQRYPSDYRVWWELCKPMDFAVVLDGKRSSNPSTINGAYFDKALDLAPLEQKMELIKQYDKYSEIKNIVLEEIQAEQERKDAEERARIEQEQRLQREAEEERKRQEELRRKEEQERLEKERQEAELKAAEFAQVQQDMRINFWQSLKDKNYTEIDDSYFQFNSPEGISIVATLKVIANVLYLSAFHINPNKGNGAYFVQSVAIHFGDNGFAIKFDNKPVTVRGWHPTANTIQIIANPKGGYLVNNLQLIKDSVYVASIYKGAKKSIIPFKKVFD